MTIPSTSKEYFAGGSASECASSLQAKAKTFHTFMGGNAYTDKITKMWRAYHGVYNDESYANHEISFTGEQGELVSLPVNHFRNIAEHIKTMITSSRPTMDARPINTDYKSATQAALASGILEYYMREKHLEDFITKAVEYAIVMGSGYVKMEWNATSGEAFDVDPETGEFAYNGELEFSNPTPMDVVFDGTKESWDHQWIMVRSFKNRYDLMAKYPEMADKIRAVPTKSSMDGYSRALWSNDDTDDIAVMEFFHKQTEALPDGRYLLFCNDDCILLDTRMPYRQIPVFRISPADYLGTSYGYSNMFDLFPIQQCVNSIYSAIQTNQTAFGVHNIFVETNANIDVSNLEGAMNVIKGNKKPEVLSLLATPREMFDFLQVLISAMETISGVNSVARGNPEASLRSGSALALVQSMALQFISGFQQSYVKLVEGSGTGILNILKDFAHTPRIVAIVGKSNKPYVQEFTGDMIKDISRVTVDMGNPLSRCFEKDTPVLMFDGTTKMVQDIKVGNLVMGHDSKPRTVGTIETGIDNMYKVRSSDDLRGFEYGCNEQHVLTLKYCSDDHRYDVKKGDIIDISIKDYLNLPGRHKRLLQGFTTKVEFKKKDLGIDPYIFGAWLGDGTSKGTCLTSMDPELVQAWTEYATSINMQVRIEEYEIPNKAKNYHITSGQMHGRSDRNPMMNELHAMEVINNKHIPFAYQTSDRNDRLQLLAGLIDTDGYLNVETFLISQKSDAITDGIIFVAKSLGFRVTHKKLKTNKSELCPNTEGMVNMVSIGGNTWEIPTKLPRKQPKEKTKARDWLNYGISVESVGADRYYGFSLVEDPHFVLGDFTVTHNSIAGRVQMAEQMMQMKLIKTPTQYFQVLQNGKLDNMFEGDVHELLLIRRENEFLLEGKPILANIYDAHRTHIMEHKSLAADPDLRFNSELMTALNAHIQEHIDMLRTVDPDLLQLLGEQPLQPLQPQQQPGMPPQEGGGPPPGPNKGSMDQGMDRMMQPQQGMNQEGDSIVDAVGGPQSLPSVPSPPPPFSDLPTDPAKM